MSIREALIRAGIIKPARKSTETKEAESAKPSITQAKTTTTPAPKTKAKPKSWHKKTLWEKVQARATEREAEPKKHGLTCVLCGKQIPHGKLLEHKQQEHKERMIAPSPVRETHPPDATFVRGGSPGLKKK
jgi:hypothetical protein